MGKFSQLFSVSDPQRDCLSLGISAQDEAGMDLFATLTSINYVSAVVLSANVRSKYIHATSSILLGAHARVEWNPVVWSLQELYVKYRFVISYFPCDI